MVFVMYGLTASDTITDPAGNIQANKVGQLYAQPSGGVAFTQTFAAVPPNFTPGEGTAGSVTTDDLGRFGFYTEDFFEDLWLEIEIGTRWKCSPSPNQTITAVTSQIAADLQQQLDNQTATWQTQMDEMETKVDQVTFAMSVKFWGAVGDNVADDTAAFETAGATGKPIFVPEGTYVISSLSTGLPDGWFFGPGVLHFTGADMDNETMNLDRWTPTPIKTVMIGDGHRNILAIGPNAQALAGNESGANVAIGHNAMAVSNKSQRNTAIGSGAGKFLGDYDRAGVTTTNGNARRNVWVGTDAGYASVWADRVTMIGSNAGKWTGDPDPITHQHDFYDGVPVPSLAGIDAAGRWPTARADFVGPSNAPARPARNELDNMDNVGVGRNTLLHATRASQCVALGTNAMAHGLEVLASTAIGDGALRDGINASFCTAVGASALLQNASGQFNVAVGNNALRLNTHAHRNVAMGYGALENLTGNLTAPDSNIARQNVAIGYGAAAASVIATQSVAVGANSAFGNHNNATAIGATANAVVNATAVGSGANAAGASAIALGVNASAPNTSSVAIGANAVASANNQIKIGGAGSAVVTEGPITAGGFVRTAAYTTAGRPSASTVGVGAMIFNSSTGMPNWSNGSAWVNASGVAV